MCLEYRAWLLIRELIVRTPLSTVAQLLNAHKFTTTIHKTLEWLAQKGASRKHIGGNNGEPNYDGLDSGSEQLSRKRKRDADTETWGRRNFPDSARLYTSVCCTLIQLQAIISDSSQGYVIEHLKAAMKKTSDEAASILGHSIRVVNYMNSTRKESGSIEDQIAWLTPMLNHWTAQVKFSSAKPDSADHVCPALLSLWFKC